MDFKAVVIDNLVRAEFFKDVQAPFDTILLNALRSSTLGNSKFGVVYAMGAGSGHMYYTNTQGILMHNVMTPLEFAAEIARCASDDSGPLAGIAFFGGGFEQFNHYLHNVSHGAEIVYSDGVPPVLRIEKVAASGPKGGD